MREGLPAHRNGRRDTVRVKGSRRFCPFQTVRLYCSYARCCIAPARCLVWVIMIEYGFRLFVLKEFQRNECKKRLPAIRTLIRRKRILQPVRFAESLFQVGSEGQGIVHSVLVKENLPSPSGLNIEKENPSVLRRMDKVYCSDLLKSVVSIIRIVSVDYSQLPALLLAVSRLPIIRPEYLPNLV